MPNNGLNYLLVNGGIPDCNQGASNDSIYFSRNQRLFYLTFAIHTGQHFRVRYAGGDQWRVQYELIVQQLDPEKAHTMSMRATTCQYSVIRYMECQMEFHTLALRDWIKTFVLTKFVYSPKGDIDALKFGNRAEVKSNPALYKTVLCSQFTVFPLMSLGFIESDYDEEPEIKINFMLQRWLDSFDKLVNLVTGMGNVRLCTTADRLFFGLDVQSGRSLGDMADRMADRMAVRLANQSATKVAVNRDDSDPVIDLTANMSSTNKPQMMTEAKRTNFSSINSTNWKSNAPAPVVASTVPTTPVVAPTTVPAAPPVPTTVPAAPVVAPTVPAAPPAATTVPAAPPAPTTVAVTAPSSQKPAPKPTSTVMVGRTWGGVVVNPNPVVPPIIVPPTVVKPVTVIKPVNTSTPAATTAATKVVISMATAAALSSDISSVAKPLSPTTKLDLLYQACQQAEYFNQEELESLKRKFVESDSAPSTSKRLCAQNLHDEDPEATEDDEAPSSPDRASNTTIPTTVPMAPRKKRHTHQSV